MARSVGRLSEAQCTVHGCRVLCYAWCIIAGCSVAAAAAAESSVAAALEYRSFTSASDPAAAYRHSLSASLQLELGHRLERTKDQLSMDLFARYDQHDPQRSHVDVRELLWNRTRPSYALNVGVRRVFWGVTESLHLVDIINQTDLVENIDGESKLGQPLAQLTLLRHWGTLDMFLLPYFRERSFPSRSGRLRPALPVATERARYESAQREQHLDYALRWAKSWRGADLGVSYFVGTGREPLLLVEQNTDAVELVPFYPHIRQLGLDAALSSGPWLYKLEAIQRAQRDESFAAAIIGVERSISGAFGSGADIGLFAEYAYDQRGVRSPAPLQDDLSIGVRLALNDVPASELLLFAVFDRRSGSRFFNVEGSRRLGQRWLLRLEARAFVAAGEADPLQSVRGDDYLQLQLTRFFSGNEP